MLRSLNLKWLPLSIFLVLSNSCVTTGGFETSLEPSVAVHCKSEIFDDSSLLLLMRCKWINSSIRAQTSNFTLKESKEYEVLSDAEFYQVVEDYRAKGTNLPFLAGMTIAISSPASTNSEAALGAFAVIGVSLVAKELLKPDSKPAIHYGMDSKVMLERDQSIEKLVLINPIPQKVHPQKLRFCDDSSVKEPLCKEAPIEVGVGVFRSRLWNLNF